MRAPDYETIYNVEDAVEDAAKAVLTAYGIRDAKGAPLAFAQRESDELPAEHVDITLKLGTQREHRGIISAPNAQPVQGARDSWNGTLSLTVWTKRYPKGAKNIPRDYDPQRNGKWRGIIRHAFEYFADRFTPAVLPYHDLSVMTHMNTDPQVNVDDDLDASAIHYSVIVRVRSGAWPLPAS